MPVWPGKLYEVWQWHRIIALHEVGSGNCTNVWPWQTAGANGDLSLRKWLLWLWALCSTIGLLLGGRARLVLFNKQAILLLWSPYGIGQTIHYIFALWFLLSSYFFSSPKSQPSQIGCLPYFHCGLSANLRCRSEMCCTRLAENTGRKNWQRFAIWAPSHNFVGLYLRN